MLEQKAVFLFPIGTEWLPFDMPIHERKITARRQMRAIDLVMEDAMPNRHKKPWTVLSDAEARSLALDILFLVDRAAYGRVTEPAVERR